MLFPHNIPTPIVNYILLLHGLLNELAGQESLAQKPTNTYYITH